MENRFLAFRFPLSPEAHTGGQLVKVLRFTPGSRIYLISSTQKSLRVTTWADNAGRGNGSEDSYMVTGEELESGSSGIGNGEMHRAPFYV